MGKLGILTVIGVLGGLFWGAFGGLMVMLANGQLTFRDGFTPSAVIGGLTCMVIMYFWMFRPKHQLSVLLLDGGRGRVIGLPIVREDAQAMMVVRDGHSVWIATDDERIRGRICACEMGGVACPDA